MVFADIAFPTAVREVFTYHLPDTKAFLHVSAGMRAWVPLRGTMSIGMIVKVHNNKPTFKTRPVRQILDKDPIMDAELLSLTEWIHRFYYSGWGEAIQAALPSGMNFTSVTYLQPAETVTKKQIVTDSNLNKSQRDIALQVLEEGRYPLQDVYKRWGASASKYIRELTKREIVETWQRPELKIKPKTELVWCWGDDVTTDEVQRELSPKKKLKKWEKALLFLSGSELLPANTSTLTAFQDLTTYTLSKLEQEHFLVKEEREVFIPEPDYSFDPKSISALNEPQHEAYKLITESIHKNEYASFLIYGVTGSGKTEVYIHVLKEALKQDKGALILVPEIALTPQTVRRFYKIFGMQIAILHSRLNDHERYDAWQALKKGKKTIAIGARSAVFAPVKNLGLIIIDEEHDTSYRQADPAPRYHAREVAAMRAYHTNAVLVMGSATPSLVSLANATRGKHRLLKIPVRHAGATLPKVQILDMRQYKGAMRGPLAIPLYEAVCEAIAGGEQAILLYNRRGFASFMQCEDCGLVVECPDCSVSLTYHKKLNQLRCHYCGYSQRAGHRCSGCNGSALKPRGSGTQQVEEELEKVLEHARILRMDQDTTSTKNAHDTILTAFGKGEADILVGTQLVAKGLDFPNVTVVGVINADTELAFPSYRSNERMFQLLSQVSGRSGRAGKKGRVFLQTRQSDHFTLKFAREHDFEGFARHELSLRKPLLYPPYGRMLNFSFKGKDGTLTSKVAQAFTEALLRLGTDYPVLGPSPEMIMRIKGEFRWSTMMKLPHDLKTGMISFLADKAFSEYDKIKPKSSSSVRITVSHEMI